MNLRDFKYLIAVAEHKNFRKAADACFVSQPTLSMQLKKLEEYLQIQLIERNSRNILLTDAGKEILEKAKNINYLAESIKDTANTFRNPYSGNLKIGAFPTLAPYYFPKIIPTIRESWPDLNLFLVEEKTGNLIDMLREGKIDAAFLATPIKENDFQVEPVFTENFYLATPGNSDSDFAKLEEIEPKNLKNKNLLLLEEGHCLRDQALDFCHKTGTDEDKTFRATSLETLRSMVANGMGITLIPEQAVRKDDGIRYIKFKNNKSANREIALVWRKESARGKLFNDILSKIK